MPSFSDFAGFEGFLFCFAAAVPRRRPTAPAGSSSWVLRPSSPALVSQIKNRSPGFFPADNDPERIRGGKIRP